MEEKKDLFMKISKSFLDKVSGGNCFEGELDKWDMENLDYAITLYKDAGIDLSKMLADLRKHGFSEASLSYVSSHW